MGGKNKKPKNKQHSNVEKGNVIPPAIQEPDNLTRNMPEQSIGDKKLQRQLEKEREEAEKIKKENEQKKNVIETKNKQKHKQTVKKIEKKNEERIELNKPASREISGLSMKQEQISHKLAENVDEVCSENISKLTVYSAEKSYETDKSEQTINYQYDGNKNVHYNDNKVSNLGNNSYKSNNRSFHNEKYNYKKDTTRKSTGSQYNNTYMNKDDSRRKSSDRFKSPGKFGQENYSQNKSEISDEDYNKYLERTKDKVSISYGKVSEIRGDLFSASEEYSLAHCVAEDFSMGAGIAVQFRRQFRKVSELLNQEQKTGGLAILKDKQRFIYYLVTKRLSRGKPTLYTLWLSLKKMKEHIVENKVTKLAIPQIGCGLDRLDWDMVKQMLEYIFEKVEIKIVVYIYGENAEDTPGKTLKKCTVVHNVSKLNDIEADSGIIYFGTEDNFVSKEMETLMEKFTFIDDYKRARKTVGNIIKTPIESNYILYGLIYKKSNTDKVDFQVFEKCLYDLEKMLKTDQTYYIGFQVFEENNDFIISEKIINMMQFCLKTPSIYVYWPENLQKFCPQRAPIQK